MVALLLVLPLGVRFLTNRADAHRFRVVFLLDLTITDSTRWKLALAGLARKLNGDTAIADGARMFYGNSGSEVHLIQKVLSAEALEELVELGRFQKQTVFTDTQGKVVSSRSKIKLKSEQMLTLESGETLELSAIPAGASVLCPVHLDHRPSAFVVESQGGTRGVHCRTCQSTFWEADPGDYDFDAFDRLFMEKQRQDNYLLRLFPPGSEINLFQRRYLGPLTYQTGLTIVKSPKGSGKTEALSRLIGEIKGPSRQTAFKR